MDEVKTKKKHKLGNLIGNIVFWIFAAVLGFYVISSSFFPSFSQDVFGFSTYVVVTESMTPVINVNDYIVVKKANIDELQYGDIITFKVDLNYDGKKETVTHYVDTVTPDATYGHLITTQHNYPERGSDPWTLHDEDIIGQYVFTVPLLGVIVTFVKSPFGIAVVAIDVIVIVAIIYILDDNKKKKQKKLENNKPNQP